MSPQTCLAMCLEHHDEIESVAVIQRMKGGGFRTAWSQQTMSELGAKAFLLGTEAANEILKANK